MKISTEAIILDTFTKEALKGADGLLSFKNLVFHSLNFPPAAYGARADGLSARHAAELRGGILQKVSEGNTAEFLPQEADEILSCVAAVQPPSIYLSVKAFMQTAGTDQRS